MYNSILSAAGLSQGSMEVLVLGLIAVLVLGFVIVMYWPLIVAGGIALFCVTVLANHQSPDVPKPRPVEILAPAGVPVDDAPINIIEHSRVKPVEVEKFDEAKAFLEDCLNMTDYSKNQCKKLWDGREDESVVLKEPALFKLLDVDNKEYKQRRAEALKKQNAVVAQYTFR